MSRCLDRQGNGRICGGCLDDSTSEMGDAFEVQGRAHRLSVFRSARQTRVKSERAKARARARAGASERARARAQSARRIEGREDSEAKTGLQTLSDMRARVSTEETRSSRRPARAIQCDVRKTLPTKG
eukprot:3845358-Pleurochrysis_carterae.AAC.2